MRAKLLDEGSVDAEKALDYLSEVGDEGERATAKFDMARIFARCGVAEATALANPELIALASNNLAQLLERTNRIGEAEPLMRRALEIEVGTFGEQHPNVAIRLNNLAALLYDTNRLEEAEPLTRQSLDIFDSFRRQTGHEHPEFQRVNWNYQALQRAMESEELD